MPTEKGVASRTWMRWRGGAGKQSSLFFFYFLSGIASPLSAAIPPKKSNRLSTHSFVCVSVLRMARGVRKPSSLILLFFLCCTVYVLTVVLAGNR